MSEAHDLRAEFGPARDQGLRGTCLAFAVTAVHEQARRRQRGELTDDLGEELLYWLCKQVDGDRQPGTSPRSATQALTEDGASPPPVLWPYDGARDDATPDYAPPAAALIAAEMRRATLRSAGSDLDTLRNLVRSAHAVVLGLEIWQGFYLAHGGDLGVPAPAELLGDRHAVAVVRLRRWREGAAVAQLLGRIMG